MDSRENIPLRLEDAPHPGDIIIDYLESYEWSQSDLARRTGLTPKTVSEICHGKAPVTPNTALALEKVFQRPAHLWLNLQRRFDEAAARRRVRSHSAEWKSWAGKFPVAAMRKLGYLAPKTVRGEDADDLLTFFSVSTPDAWESVWESSRVAYRQTRRFQTSEEAISAWVRETEVQASQIMVVPFDENRLRSLIADLRRLTMRSVARVVEPIQQLCASAGVAVVWVPELPHTGISGCARWLTGSKAMIALTLRYKTDDQMWFTFFHELGHLLLHRKVRSFVLDNAAEHLGDGVVDPEMQKYEDEANRFAADTLIPPEALAGFIRANTVIESDALKAFADAIEIAPGVVVGRLQREGLLKAHQGNTFKQRVGFKIAFDTDSD